VYDYDVDDEGTIIQLGDWYHKPTSILLSEFFSVSLPVARLHCKELIFLDSPFSQPDNGGGHEPVADAGTINGRGRCSARAPNPAECPQDVPWARINVQQGKKYRMRLINNSAFGHFHVRFEDHPMTVIEADGILHQPLVRDEVEIYAAQRYSVIVSSHSIHSRSRIRAHVIEVLD
jgi:iron transport multicopper oxidase